MKKLAKFLPIIHNGLKYIGLDNVIYQKDVNPIDHIIDNLYLGDYRAADDMNILKKYKITHIINCAFNLPDNYQKEIVYKRLDLKDESNQPLLEKMKEAYKFIKENKDKNIFIHCVFGKSRSGSVAIFYIMNEKKVDYNTAKQMVQKIRKIVNPNEGFEKELTSYYENFIKNKNNNESE